MATQIYEGPFSEPYFVREGYIDLDTMSLGYKFIGTPESKYPGEGYQFIPEDVWIKYASEYWTSEHWDFRSIDEKIEALKKDLAFYQGVHKFDEINFPKHLQVDHLDKIQEIKNKIEELKNSLK